MSRQHLTPYHFTWAGFLLSLFQHPPVNSASGHILSLREKKPGARTFLLITSSCHQKISLFVASVEVIHITFNLSSLYWKAITTAAALLLSMNYCLWSGHWLSMVSTHGLSTVVCNLIISICTHTHTHTHTPLCYGMSACHPISSFSLEKW